LDEWDAYFWPNSTVLKNKVGLTHAASLRAFEYEATRQRAEQLRAQPLAGRFDTAHYRAIHHHLFQDVYEWAGAFRKVEFSKGSSAFAPLKTATHSLESWGEKILGDIAAENYLKGLKKTAFVERLTHHYGELNFWHPMREGNGRATKEFLFHQSNNDRQLLQMVEGALSRIREGSFGECISCGKEINAKRLEAVPWTRHCIECQEKAEQGLLEETHG